MVVSSHSSLTSEIIFLESIKTKFKKQCDSQKAHYIRNVTFCWTSIGTAALE